MSERRPWLTALLSLTLLTIALGGPESAKAGTPDSLKYWILFEDRGAGEPEDLTAEISDRALERRIRRGLDAAATADFSVSTNYIRSLSESGVQHRVVSRWLNGVSAYLTPTQLKQVRDLPFVRVVRPVGSSYVARTTPALDLTDRSVASPLFSPSASMNYGPSVTQLSVANAIPPLEAGYNGTGVRLGFLDTTYDGFSHPAFTALRDDERLIEVRDFTGLPQSNTHGRSVASIAIGNQPGELVGPAHGVEVLAATTEYAPTETNQEEDNFVAGMEWLEAMGADVVNVSLGYTTFDEGQNSYTIADLDGDTGITTVAADIAASLGVVVVTSAGNWVSFGCGSPAECWYRIGTPADGDSVVAVGAVDATGTRGYFSSYGPTADGRIKPDVSAMGVSVYHAQSSTGYGSGSGTSFSAPMVSGVVCQMLQANPGLKPMQVLDILRQSGNQSQNPDNSLGWGVINAEVAVAAAIAVSTENETPPASFAVSAYPNPFDRHVTFRFRTITPGRASVRVFDLLGRQVGPPQERDVHSGEHAIIWHGDTLSSGVYVYVLETPDGTGTGRLVHL